MTSQALSLLNDLTPQEDLTAPIVSTSPAFNASTMQGLPSPSPVKRYSDSHTAVDSYSDINSNSLSSTASTVSILTRNVSKSGSVPQQQKRPPGSVSVVVDGSTIKINRSEFTDHLSQIFYHPTSTEFHSIPSSSRSGDSGDSPVGATVEAVLLPVATLVKSSPIDVSVPKAVRNRGSVTKYTNPFDDSDGGTTGKNPFDDVAENSLRMSSGSQNPFDDDEAPRNNNIKSATGAKSRSTSISVKPKALQYSDYKHHSSPLVFDDSPRMAEVNTVEPQTETRKMKLQKEIDNSTLMYIANNEWFKANPNAKSIESVNWINKTVRHQCGRDFFTYELNQFRSKQVMLEV